MCLNTEIIPIFDIFNANIELGFFLKLAWDKYTRSNLKNEFRTYTAWKLSIPHVKLIFIFGKQTKMRLDFKA